MCGTHSEFDEYERDMTGGDTFYPNEFDGDSDDDFDPDEFDSLYDEGWEDDYDWEDDYFDAADRNFDEDDDG